MTPPINIDGTQITGASIDGSEVQEITVDGTQVFSAITLIDSYEDGNLSEYSTFAQNGDNTTVSSTQSKDGSNSVRIRDSGGQRASIVSTSGLNAFPSQGDVVRAFVFPNGSTNPRFIRASDGTQGTKTGFATGYHFGVRISVGDIVIIKHTSNNESVLASESNSSLSGSQFFDIRTEYQTNDTLKMEVFDDSGQSIAGPITATDSTFAGNQGVGFADLLGDSFGDFIRIP